MLLNMAKKWAELNLLQVSAFREKNPVSLKKVQ